MSNRKLNIWYFHHYATPPNINGMDRPYDLGTHLTKYGHDMSIFASSYLHYAGYNIISGDDKYLINNDTNIPFVFCKTNGYSTNGLDRVKNMFSFYKNLFNVSRDYLTKTDKPDVIIASSPHPLTMIAGIQIAKKLGVPCICEVRDFWPEVIFLGGKLKENSLIGKLLTNVEYWIYKNANALIFLKPGDYTYITEKHWDTDNGGKVNLEKCYYINNGVNLENFDRLINEAKLIDTDLKNDKFKVVYTGSIRSVNNIGDILDAAKLLESYKDIEFLIYGEGNEVEYLNNRIQEENITNVKMKGYVKKKHIPYILSNASLNLLNYSQKRYNWNRGNSSNKLFEYMASSKPIISTVKMGYSIIDKYKCGIEIEDAKPEELANAILQIKNLPLDEYTKIGRNAREAANDFDFSVLSNKLQDVITETLNGYKSKK